MSRSESPRAQLTQRTSRLGRNILIQFTFLASKPPRIRLVPLKYLFVAGLSVVDSLWSQPPSPTRLSFQSNVMQREFREVWYLKFEQANSQPTIQLAWPSWLYVQCVWFRFFSAHICQLLDIDTYLSWYFVTKLSFCLSLRPRRKLKSLKYVACSLPSSLPFCFFFLSLAVIISTNTKHLPSIHLSRLNLTQSLARSRQQET